MLFKLAFRNAKRSIKDYLIYLITITIAVALIFAFNSIIYSEDIMALSSMFDSFKAIIIILSIIIILNIGWLINYTITFMFHRRSKEFGTYILLGIDNKRLARLFLLENIIIELIAFVMGIFLGTYLFQVITAIIMNIFNNPYQISIHVSFKAIALTLGYISLISVFSLLRHKRKFSKMNIKDLIYADKQNEKSIIKNKSIRNIIFFLSIITIVYSIVLFKNALGVTDQPNPNFIQIMMSIIILIFGLYGFYMSFSNFFILLIKNKKVAYKHTNLFLIRTLTAKINTIGMTFGTLAVLFTLTIVSLNISSTFKGIFETISLSQAPTDFVVTSNDKDETFDNYREYISTHFTILDEFQYYTYFTSTSEINEALSDSLYSANGKDDYLIKLSDYNRLLDLLGEDQVILGPNHFIISSPYNGLEDTLLKSQGNIHFNINGIELTYKETNKIAIPQRFSNYMVVVPDEFVSETHFKAKFYAVDTLEETSEKDYNEISKYIQPVKSDNGTEFIPVGNIRIKGHVESQDKALFIILAFSCYYLALIFICTALTILSIQQLSDSTKYQYRYTILERLGLSKEKINILVFKQLFYFYLIPTILPIIISYFIVQAINNLFFIYLKNENSGYIYFGQMLGLFLTIYVLYFVTTFIGFIKNIRS